MLKKLLLIVSGAVIFFLLLAVSLPFLFEDELKTLFKEKLTQQTNGKVAVSGEVNFSFLKNFPYASVTFEGVKIGGLKQPLLQAQEFSLLFSLQDMIRKEYEVKKISAKNGRLSININKKGETNYDFLQSSSSTGENFQFSIEKAEFKNFKITYISEPQAQHYIFLVHNLDLSGQFSSEQYRLYIDADVLIEQLKIKDQDYFAGKEAEIKSALKINSVKKEYIFEKNKIELAGNHFSISGKITDKELTQLNLVIQGQRLQLKEAIALLPESTRSYLQEYDAEGDVNFSAKIAGTLSAAKNPSITADFSLENSSLGHSKLSEKIENISFKGSFDNGKFNSLRSSSLKINDLTFKSNDENISGSLSIDGLEEPVYRLSATGRIEAASLLPFLQNDSLNEFSGTIAMENISAAFTADKMLQHSGKIVAENVSIRYKNKVFKDIAGQIHLSDNKIDFDPFTITMGENIVAISATSAGLADYFFSSDTEKLKISGTLTSDFINLGPFFGEEETRGGTTAMVPLFGRWNINVKRVAYDKFEAENIIGAVDVQLPDRVEFRELFFEAMNGKVQADGSLDFRNKKTVLQADINAAGVDVRELFYRFENFNQQVLTSENLKGNLSSNIKIYSVWDDKGQFIYEQLITEADIKIENGELINFQPLKSLSAYVRLSELEHVKFSILQNEIEIKDGRIFIPWMSISSNAMNFDITGTHTFNNEVDYKMKINLTHLMANKFKRSNPEKQEEQLEGGLNLFLTMTGTVDEPVIKYDKQQVKEKIKEDLQKEKEELKEVLRNEFSGDEKQEIKDEKPEEVEFIEWD